MWSRKNLKTTSSPKNTIHARYKVSAEKIKFSKKLPCDEAVPLILADRSMVTSEGFGKENFGNENFGSVKTSFEKTNKE